MSRPRGISAWPRSLIFPAVSAQAVLRAAAGPVPEEALTQLFDWERDRLLGLAKGVGAAAVSTLIALVGVAVDGAKDVNVAVAVVLVVLSLTLLGWGGVILVGLQRLGESYALARWIVFPEPVP